MRRLSLKWLVTLAYSELPLLLLLLYTWFYASAMLARVTDPDPGLFESFAFHMHHGKVLYADIWDHKPPLVFFLNLLFLKLFGISEDAISYGSLLLCLIQTWVFFRLCLELMRNRVAAFIGALSFVTIFFSVFVFGSGNYTEQYGVLCTTSGLLVFISFIRYKRHSDIWLSGMLFGLSVWFKEPFAFSVLPYGIYLLVRAVRHRKESIFLVEFILAFLVPALLTMNAVVMTGGKEGYLEHLVHSRLYAKSSNTAPLLTKLADNYSGFFSPFPLSNFVLIPLYLVCTGLLLWLERKQVVFLLIFGQQICDYVATGMSGNRFFHYYQQTAPLTILLLFCAVYLLFTRLIKTRMHGPAWALPILLCLIFIANVKPWRSLSLTPSKTFDDGIATWFKHNIYYKPRAVALAGKDIGFYLLRVHGISEVRYIVPYPYHWINIPAKPVHHQKSEDSARFMNWDPEFVITSGKTSEMYEDCGLDSIISARYIEVAHTELLPDKQAFLLRRQRDESN